jgi:hypothetical protein
MREWYKLILLKMPNSRSPMDVYFWIDSVSLSSWADWNYANAKLGEMYLDNVQSVYLYDGGLTNSLKVAADIGGQLPHS